MRIKPMHTNFTMPIKSTKGAGAFDIYMPDSGYANGTAKLILLGFAAKVPEGHVALILPRSGCGAEYGVELNNTCGVIDSDYLGEWKAAIKTKSGLFFPWEKGERILQFLVVPIAQVNLEQADDLGTTERGSGGFGSSGK